MLPAAAVRVQHRILLRLAVVVMANIYSTALSCSLVILHSMITSALSTAEWTLMELMNTMHSFHVSIDSSIITRKLKGIHMDFLYIAT